MKPAKIHLLITFLCFLSGCKHLKKHFGSDDKKPADQFIVIMGIAQDAGYPQIGCEKECCKAYWDGTEEKKHVTSLALIDKKADQYWLIEATPDITSQLHALQPYLKTESYTPSGVLLTHAHIGHYAGLMYLGREAIGAKDIPVWAMPSMDSFLRNNGPWSQLVTLHNIELKQLKEDSVLQLNSAFKITPFRVPHRDEFSETVGYKIESETKKVLFIPDIDKWEKWNRDIIEEIKKVDIAIIDGTFYHNGELPGRDMSEIPHPFVEESMKKFAGLSKDEKDKIIFIHFNHTNPLLKKRSAEKDAVKEAGYRVAREGMIIEL